jgi:hypothetical protein
MIGRLQRKNEKFNVHMIYIKVKGAAKLKAIINTAKFREYVEKQRLLLLE